MNKSSNSTTPATSSAKKQYQPDVNVYLSRSHIPTNYSKYPKITVKEETPNSEDRIKKRNLKSSKGAKRDSKVMKFKFLTGEDTTSGVSELIVGTENTNIKQYQTDINLSLSKSIVPTNYAKYPRITVGPKAKDRSKASKKAERTVTAAPPKIPAQVLRACISEMNPRQLASLLKPFAPEKLLSIQDSISKVLESKRREMVITKKKQIEKLKRELKDLERMS